jgi:WD40 repeat protein
MSPPPAALPPPPATLAPRTRVFSRGDYKLIGGSFALLALFVVLLMLLISAFKQRMAVHWLRHYARRPKGEIRQYVEILSQEAAVSRLDDWRRNPDGMPALFAAMALARTGEAGTRLLRAETDAGDGAGRVAALAGLEYAQPGSLLPLLQQDAGGSACWIEAVHAAALADAYAAVDIAREIDGHFIALFPGRKAIPAAVMNAYQGGINGLFTDADIPDKLVGVRTFHAAQLRAHPELYKPGVLKKVRDAWDNYLTQVFEQRRVAYASQEAVRAAATHAAGLSPEAWGLVNRFLAGRYPDNPADLLAPAGCGSGPPCLPEAQAGGRGSPPPRGETVLHRTGAPLRALAASADGSMLAAGGFDNFVRIWETGREADARACTGHVFGVMAVALSPDGSRLVSAGLDGTIRVWDVRAGGAATCWPAGTRRVAALAFAPGGDFVAVGGAGGTIRLLDVGSGVARRVLRKHTSEVTALAFTPDGKRLLAASLDKTISVWDLADATAEPRVLDKHAGEVWTLAVAPDGRWLASGSADRRVMLWDLQNLKRRPRTLKGHRATVTALAASPDGALLASAGGDGQVMVWNAASGKRLGAHLTAGTVNALRFEPDGKVLLLAGDDGTLRRWTVALRDERPFSFGDWVLWLSGKE